MKKIIDYIQIVRNNLAIILLNIIIEKSNVYETRTEAKLMG